MSLRSGSKLKLGLVGCGAIGAQLAQAISRRKIAGVKIVSLTDTVSVQAQKLAQRIKPRPRILTLSAAVRQCDLLIEAAGTHAVIPIAQAVLREKKDLLVLSVGALIDHPELRDRFRKHHCHLHFPSGAIAGLDALKAAAALGTIKSVRLITRKPPRGLAGAPFFKQKKLDLLSLKQPTVIFAGTARRAIRLFPANVNVAAAVALVGIGADRTKVEIIADPAIHRNSHTLEVSGCFGQFKTITENIPSPENPKTSSLAAASALAALVSIIQGDRSGT